MSEDDVNAFIADLQREFPRFELVPKAQRPSQRLIDAALRALTAGRNTAYLTRVVTTLGQKVYVPTAWHTWRPLDRIIILRHEAVHLRQFRRLTWAGMGLIYLFLPLPFLFAGGRAWLELEAYKETLKATWELKGAAAARDPALREAIVRRFTGSDYGWMWVRGTSIRKALNRTIVTLEEKFGSK
jgi:hypothetical protein